MVGVPAYSRDGELAGMMAFPNIDGKELFGTRLAFDLLGCCDDEDQVAQTLAKYFTMIKDPSHTFLVAFAALEPSSTTSSRRCCGSSKIRRATGTYG